jgi:hypothetical protein
MQLRSLMPDAAMVELQISKESSMIRSAYRAGICVALLAAFLTVWTTIVRDDGGGAAFFMIISAVGVGWFAAGFRAAGMARAMVGVAVMQVLLGMLYATAPVTAAEPNGVLKAVVFTCVFTLLWLVSGNFFRIAAKSSPIAA